MFGEAADGTNAVISLMRGNYADAALSAAAMIPVAGWAATAGKGAKYALKAADAVKAADAIKEVAKHTDEAAELSGAAKKFVDNTVASQSRYVDNAVASQNKYIDKVTNSMNDVVDNSNVRKAVGDGAGKIDIDIAPKTRVGQWMCKSEYEQFVKTGEIPRTNVLTKGMDGYIKQAGKGDLYVEFNINPSLLAPKNESLGWSLVKPKNQMYIKLYQNKGLTLPDSIGKNITHVYTK